MKHVSVQELQDAFEDMLRRYLQIAPGEEDAVRSAWPLDQLIQENAEAWFNGKVLTVTTRSGFSSWGHPDAHEVDLPPAASDHELGLAVNEGLSHSRELTLRDLNAEIGALDRDQRKAQYDQWLARFMARHGYKTKRALFFTMLHVTINRRAGRLELSPSNHDRLDGWSGDGLARNSAVALPADSPAADIGVALRLAFSRCLDTYKK